MYCIYGELDIDRGDSKAVKLENIHIDPVKSQFMGTQVCTASDWGEKLLSSLWPRGVGVCKVDLWACQPVHLSGELNGWCRHTNRLSFRGTVPHFEAKERFYHVSLFFFKNLYVVKYRKCRNVPLFLTFSLTCPSFWNLKVGKYGGGCSLTRFGSPETRLTVVLIWFDLWK